MSHTKNAARTAPDTPPADRLPRLSPTARRARKRASEFTGTERGSGYPWGVMSMTNFSPRRSPAAATRLPRELLVYERNQTLPHGMAMLEDDLYFVQGTMLYRIPHVLDAVRDTPAVEHVGELSDTDKRMTVFGDRLIILPDKQYVDAADGVLRPIELDTDVLSQLRFDGNTLSLPDGMNWRALGFLPGDTVYVINADDVTPAPEGYYCIKELHGQHAVMMSTFPAVDTCDARLRRVFPDMDDMAVCGNRLIGYREKEICISAENAPFSFRGYRPDGQGGTTLRSDTAGDITACAAWQGYMMFFKASSICRVLGTRADSFSLYEFPAPGIPAALSRTLCEVGGELYYHGDAGIYRYANATQRPERVGTLGDTLPTSGRGGTDGVAYYLDLAERASATTVTWCRHLYLPETGMWYTEDAMKTVANLTLGGFLCTQDSTGRVWLSRSDGRAAGCRITEKTLLGEVHAMVTFRPDHADVPGGYRPVALCLRLTGESVAGSRLRVAASFADGRMGKDAEAPLLPAADGSNTYVLSDRAEQLALIPGGMRDRLVRIPLSRRCCDGMILALDAVGAWEIGDVVLEYEVVS